MEPSLVMGDWKNFEFTMIREDKFSDVRKHLRENFYEDEPTQILVGMTEERANDLDTRLTHFLTDNLSFMATEKNTGKIAGVMIIRDCKKGKAEPEFDATSPLTLIVRPAFIKLHSALDIFSKFGVDHFADLYVISVSKEFRGVGLATEMYRRGISMVTDMGYPLVESTFTNPISRKIGTKLGFEEILRMYYADFKTANGKRIFPKASPEQFVNVTVLKLK